MQSRPAAVPASAVAATDAVEWSEVPAAAADVVRYTRHFWARLPALPVLTGHSFRRLLPTIAELQQADSLAIARLGRWKVPHLGAHYSGAGQMAQLLTRQAAFDALSHALSSPSLATWPEVCQSAPRSSPPATEPSSAPAPSSEARPPPCPPPLEPTSSSFSDSESSTSSQPSSSSSPPSPRPALDSQSAPAAQLRQVILNRTFVVHLCVERVSLAWRNTPTLCGRVAGPHGTHAFSTLSPTCKKCLFVMRSRQASSPRAA